MTPVLPAFRYHPDPVRTGSVQQSPVICLGCERQRDFTYTGPVYAVEELDDQLCPWCISDGTAAAKFDAEFTDVGVGVPSDVPRHVIDQVARQTPGFAGWQQEHWLYHCGDAAAFMGPCGYAQIAELPDAVKALEAEASHAGWDAVQTREHIQSLREDAPPTAYQFQCLHCGTHLAYSDFT